MLRANLRWFVVPLLFCVCVAFCRTGRSQSEVTGKSARPVRSDWPALEPFEKNARWPTPKLDDDRYRKWITFIQPSAEDLKWKAIRWHKSLSVAADEARRLQRPILLWTMNGHPCGET